MNPDKDAPKQAPDKRREEEEKLDQAIDDSFPASDPLPISPTTTGAPKHANGVRGERKPSAPRKH